jgi:hypothetical protein
MKQYIAALLVAFAVVTPVTAQSIDSNYPDRRALIVNTAPQVELSGFGFKNAYKDRRTRFETSMRWKNLGTQPITALEIVILKYDAFNRRLIGERWTVTGNDSANWSPLQPGSSSGDGTIGFGEELVFTAVAYVRAVRLVDGTVWEVNPTQLLAELKKSVPGFKDFGRLEPDPKGKQDSQ